MKKLFVLALGVVIVSGCAASVPVMDDPVVKEAKTFRAPDKNMAGIYVYRINTSLGAALTKSIWIDNKCIGDTARGVFFYQQVSGNRTHTITTQSEFSPNELTIATKSGSLYFIEQEMRMGVFSGGADLVERDPAEAKKVIMGLDMAKMGTCTGTLKSVNK